MSEGRNLALSLRGDKLQSSNDILWMKRDSIGTRSTIASSFGMNSKATKNDLEYDRIFNGNPFSCKPYKDGSTLRRKTERIINSEELWTTFQESLAKSNVFTSVGVKIMLEEFCSKHDCHINRDVFDSKENGKSPVEKYHSTFSEPLFRNFSKRLSLHMLKSTNSSSLNNISARKFSVESNPNSQGFNKSISKIPSVHNLKKSVTVGKIPSFISFDKAQEFSEECDCNSLGDTMPLSQRKFSKFSSKRSQSVGSTNIAQSAAIVAAIDNEEDSLDIMDLCKHNEEKECRIVNIGRKSSPSISRRHSSSSHSIQQTTQHFRKIAIESCNINSSGCLSKGQTSQIVTNESLKDSNTSAKGKILCGEDSVQDNHRRSDSSSDCTQDLSKEYYSSGEIVRSYEEETGVINADVPVRTRTFQRRTNMTFVNIPRVVPRRKNMTFI